MKYLVGFFGVFIGSYDIEVVYCYMIVVYINKVFGGVVYVCLFCIIEVVYFVEWLVDCLVFELKMDLVELCLWNLLWFN